MDGSVQYDQRVHFRTQIHQSPGPGVCLVKFHRAIVLDNDFAEKINVGDKVSMAQAVFSEFNKEVVAGIAVESIAVLLEPSFAVFGGYDLCSGAT